MKLPNEAWRMEITDLHRVKTVDVVKLIVVPTSSLSLTKQQPHRNCDITTARSAKSNRSNRSAVWFNQLQVQSQ